MPRSLTNPEIPQALYAAFRRIAGDRLWGVRQRNRPAGWNVWLTFVFAGAALLPVLAAADVDQDASEMSWLFCGVTKTPPPLIITTLANTAKPAAQLQKGGSVN